MVSTCNERKVQVHTACTLCVIKFHTHELLRRFVLKPRSIESAPCPLGVALEPVRSQFSQSRAVSYASNGATEYISCAISRTNPGTLFGVPVAVARGVADLRSCGPVRDQRYHTDRDRRSGHCRKHRTQPVSASYRSRFLLRGILQRCTCCGRFRQLTGSVLSPRSPKSGKGVSKGRRPLLHDVVRAVQRHTNHLVLRVST